MRDLSELRHRVRPERYHDLGDQKSLLKYGLIPPADIPRRRLGLQEGTLVGQQTRMDIRGLVRWRRAVWSSDNVSDLTEISDNLDL